MATKVKEDKKSAGNASKVMRDEKGSKAEKTDAAKTTADKRKKK
jgi:hypothetical protein